MSPLMCTKEALSAPGVLAHPSLSWRVEGKGGSGISRAQRTGWNWLCLNILPLIC